MSRPPCVRSRQARPSRRAAAFGHRAPRAARPYQRRGQRGWGRFRTPRAGGGEGTLPARPDGRGSLRECGPEPPCTKQWTVHAWQRQRPRARRFRTKGPGAKPRTEGRARGRGAECVRSRQARPSRRADVRTPRAEGGAGTSCAVADRPRVRSRGRDALVASAECVRSRQARPSRRAAAFGRHAPRAARVHRAPGLLGRDTRAPPAHVTSRCGRRPPPCCGDGAPASPAAT